MAIQRMNGERIITATQVRRNFGAIVERLRKRREHAIIQSSGTPIAVLLPLAEYEQLVAHKQRKAALRDLTRRLGREANLRGISGDNLMTGLEETKRQVFNEQYGKPSA
jgi:prevent-host-death family protein